MLERAHVDDVRLLRLLQLYMHEWSASLPMKIGADALFVYDGLEAWRDTARHAAWLFLDDSDEHAPVGFALVAIDESETAHVEELFVIAAVRRRGVGAHAARALFGQRPGTWTLTVRPENERGLAFWRAILPHAAVVSETGTDSVVRTRFSFTQ